ncbi:FMN reductase, partial [Enterobacter cloacae]
CVNTRSTGQAPLSNLFGCKTLMQHRFAAARLQTGVTGCPQLAEALVSFDCRISQVVSVGTHVLLFCAIEAIHRHATPYGLVWFDRSYHALMRPAC